jgi:hypothetical protein
MNSSLRIVFVAGAFSMAAGSISGKTGREIAPERTLSIHLYDQAQVPAGTLHLATVEATRLFRAAGIQVIWQQPPAEPPEDRGIDMRSIASRQPDERRYFVVRIMRRIPATVFPGALGFALPLARTGAHVSIFYDRVEALTRSVSAALYVILGHAMAHEIGHILLRSSEHAGGGLMQARWNQASWSLASAGLLTFRPEEAKRMGEGLLRFSAPYKFPEHESLLASSQ